MDRDADRSQAARSTPRTPRSGRLAALASVSGLGGLSFVLLVGLLGLLLGYMLGALGETREESHETAAARSRTGSFALGGREVLKRIDSASSFSDELGALRRDLEEERRAREQLAEQLAELRATVDLAALDVYSQSDSSDHRTSEGVSEVPAGSAASAKSHPGPALAKKQRQRSWFNREALGRAGISSSELAEVEGRWEEHEMDKLYLADQSKRDGTFGTRGYKLQVARLQYELREDLGPEGYDALLYATGKNNRVAVREVLENSPAGRAGIKAGDVVISYSGQRLFVPQEFKSATAAGELGAPVVLEVRRDGERYRLSVPRGPLGVLLESIKEPPLQNW